MTMTAAHVTPFLPTGRQICEGAYPASVVSQLEQLSLCVLRKLLAPLLLRWQGRRARRLLLHSTLDNLAGSRGEAEAQVRQAAESAVHFTSALGQAMPSLSGASEEGVGGVTDAATSGAGSRRPSSRPPRASLSYPADSVGLHGGGEGDEAAEEGEGGPGEAQDKWPAGDSGHAAVAALSAEALTSADADGDRFAAGAASPVQGLQQQQQQPAEARPLTASQQRDTADAKASIASTLRGHLQLRTYLQLEHIQSSLEPAHEVLVLLSGSLRRRYPVVGPAGAVGAVDGGSGFVFGGGTTLVSPSRMGSPNAGRSPTSRRPTASGATTPTSTSQGSRTRSGVLRASTRRGSHFQQSQRQQHPVAPGNVFACDVLRAPLVLGELATLGGFPFSEELVVESPRALIGAVDKVAYCGLVATLPSPVQKRLMVAALKQRERLLPYYAPMTEGRLRLCPLLSKLGKEELAHVRDHLVPRVFAAGMVCSESTDPQHIFFIRRGLVRMEREGFANVERGAATSPKNRTLLVEGQTFGESPCIFRESLGDLFYALNHVDAYLLPFRVLIQLMKQQPEVQSVVYSCARALSMLRERDFEGVLRFHPGGDVVRGLQGVSNRRSSIFGRRGSSVNRRPSAIAANSRYGSRANSVLGIGGCAGGAASVHFALAASPSGVIGPAETTASRRVTIYEEEGQQAAAGGDGAGLVGGKVSTGLVAAMRRVPLLSLFAPEEALDDLQQCWRCIRYDKGDVIARRGEECNRVLFLYEGRAGIVVDENALRRELQPTPFGTTDLAVLASAQSGVMDGGAGNEATLPLGAMAVTAAAATAGVLQTIPQGHMVGYTCVLRHRWTRTVLAVDDEVEVWELPRASLVNVLRRHGLERRLCTAAQQVLQPLVAQRERFYALDYQPLCRPMPSSLWAEQCVVNVHPVRLSEAVLFPVWREGDFPLDRTAVEAAK